jgi:hypothetical protein
MLWAITPEGHTFNLGEILRNGNSSKLDVTDTVGKIALIDAKCRAERRRCPRHSREASERRPAGKRTERRGGP